MSTFALLFTTPHLAPPHRLFDAKLLDAECLVYVLHTWLDTDAHALAFVRLDARLYWTLFHRYRIKRRWQLEHVLVKWRISSLVSRDTLLITDPIAHASTMISPQQRLIPSFTIVESITPRQYSTIPEWLFERIAEPRFAFTLSASTFRPTTDYSSPLTARACPRLTTVLMLDASLNPALHERSLPTTLRQLTFGSSFNQPIGFNVLPASLQSLTFGRSFNQPIAPEVLPHSLQHLSFGKRFDQPLHPTVVPPSVRSLSWCLRTSTNNHVLRVGAQLFVSTFDGSRVDVYDLTLRQLVHTVDRDDHAQPLGIACHHTQSLLYVQWNNNSLRAYARVAMSSSSSRSAPSSVSSSSSSLSTSSTIPPNSHWVRAKAHDMVLNAAGQNWGNIAFSRVQPNLIYACSVECVQLYDTSTKREITLPRRIGPFSYTWGLQVLAALDGGRLIGDLLVVANQCFGTIETWLVTFAPVPGSTAASTAASAAEARAREEETAPMVANVRQMQVFGERHNQLQAPSRFASPAGLLASPCGRIVIAAGLQKRICVLKRASAEIGSSFSVASTTPQEERVYTCSWGGQAVLLNNSGESDGDGDSAYLPLLVVFASSRVKEEYEWMSGWL